MAFGVFMHRSDSIYDDSPAERYQFPSQYLGRVSACINDWIVYYEPVKVRGSRGYFAVAKVEQVIPDPQAPGIYIAVIEPGSYLEFANTVPFNGRGACMSCRWCVGFACEVNAKCGTQNTVIPGAIATGNCDVRTGCTKFVR